MVSSISILSFYAIYAIYLTSDALLIEGLISDHMAKDHQFFYQVPIMGKPNFTNNLELIGSAGIIAEDKILAAAQNFVDEQGKHREFRFSIFADTIDVNNSRNKEIDIHLIFLVNQEPYFVNDISVALLDEKLDLVNNPRLGKLPVSSIFDDDAWGETGIVAGYGYNRVVSGFIEGEPDLKRLEGESDGLLRYFEVKILYTTGCIFGNPFSSRRNVLCAKPLNIQRDNSWGLCQNDTGSPLVSRRQVIVGVASSSHLDCNDSFEGGLYTNVRGHYHFIDAIIENEPLGSTIIYVNRPHKLE